nr:flagellar hook-basal body complex protein FliE [Deltaproteobacteria bacterium]
MADTQFRSLTRQKAGAAEVGVPFSEVLKGSFSEVNRLQAEADQAVQELARGTGKDLHETMIALEKAEVSFKLMMQVRNKIVAAYEEIMRMQV